MKKKFNKELVMTKEDNENVENSVKCWICGNDYVDNNVQVRDTTGKFRDTAHRDCIINVKSNHKIPVVFHNLKNCHSHLIMQKLGKCNFKINVIPNELARYMSFIINNNASFIDSFQFLCSSLDSLLRHVGKDDIKYLSQVFE